MIAILQACQILERRFPGMIHAAPPDMRIESLAFIEGLGGPEVVLILVIVMVLFGGKKLPEFARGLGKSIREFKKAAAGVEEELKRAIEGEEREPPAAPPAERSPPQSTTIVVPPSAIPSPSN